MDVCYCLGNGSLYNNAEIFHSLRLLEKHCKFDRVFIIGEKPEQAPIDYLYIPFTEKLNRTSNVFMKLVTMCDTDISEDFLYMMDDVFIIKNIIPETYPLYHSGTIREYRMLTPYLGEVLETKRFLERHNKPTLHFGVHCPIVYNKKKILEIDSFYWKYVNSKEKRYGLNPRILYGNWFDGDKKYIEDLKITKDFTLDALRTKIKDKEWFSIGSKSFDGNTRKLIEEL